MSYNTLLVESAQGVATVTLNRPQVLNAMNEELSSELAAAVSELDASEEVRAIVFTGSGDRAFSAGADIHEMAERVAGQESGLPPMTREQEERDWSIASMRTPTIGAINGLAYGGGAVMASSFDIRVGCERSSFRFLAASYGRVNATWSLPMQIGWPAAKELLFTARVVEADEAYRMGLLNRLVPSPQLMDASLEIARQIADNDPRMVAGIKGLLIDGVGSGWHEMFESEMQERQGALRPTPVREGFRDFLSRRGRGGTSS